MRSNLVTAANRYLATFNNGASLVERQANSPDQIRELLGREQDALSTASGPLSIAAVWACVGLLSDTIASLPAALYRKKADRHVLEAKHPVHELLAVAPNEVQTPFEFWRLVVVCLLLRGNFYGLKNKNGANITGIWPLNPDLTRPRFGKSGSLEYVNRENGVETVYQQDEILHIRGLSTDGITGISVLSAARKTCRSAIKMEDHGYSVFSNGAAPSGVLQTDLELNAEGYERLRKDFETHYIGSQNTGRPMILEQGLKWEQMAMTLEDSQWIESRKFARSEIAMYFRIPPQLIGDIERGTSWGSGLEQQNLGFLVYTLAPYFANIQQACVRDLLPPGDRAKFCVKFDTSILTQADFVNRQNGFQIQKRNGVISANEWRKAEGFDPIDDPEADEYGSDATAAPPAPVPGKPTEPEDDDAASSGT